jgi:carbamoyltransferase
MLLTASVKQEYRDALLSVTHVDGTARVQTITPDAQPFLAKLLACCEESTGLAVLLNTSFNDQAEPMVESPADAIRTFLSTDLDVLLVGSLLHIKQG